ncbi:11894_t:CDS:2 [Acaulospora morrowiae]|uniref:11894_t:CDS:1 n=1 Tax=Acaulospora morrowiae TaxID=94023 RepID=A0A9N9H6Y2_9GLOM|nr:11894_t:CDS:2 [Acaulospora morrowiae]
MEMQLIGYKAPIGFADFVITLLLSHLWFATSSFDYCLLRETNTRKDKKRSWMQLLIGKSAPSKIGSLDTNLRHNRWQQVEVIPLFHTFILSMTFECIVGIMTVQPGDGYLMHTRNHKL